MADTDHISASSTDLYLTCPNYFANRTKFAKGGTAGALIIGTAMHHIAEKAAADWSDLDVAAAYITKLTEMEAAEAVNWGKNDRAKAILEGHQASLSLWNYIRDLDITEVETPFDFEILPNFTLRGRIDAVAGSKVFDFKSASPRASWTENKAFDSRQPGIYLLARWAASGTCPAEFRFIVATKQGNPSLAQYIVPGGPVRALAALSVAKIIGKAVLAGILPRTNCSNCPNKGKC